MSKGGSWWFVALRPKAVILEELSQVAHVTVTTDDGTYGTKGYVSTDYLLWGTWHAQICQYQIP